MEKVYHGKCAIALGTRRHASPQPSQRNRPLYRRKTANISRNTRKTLPPSTLIFTADNATVYRISQEFLIPHNYPTKPPVKERHEILQNFRSGEYKTIVASHVLNEGVDVPDARIAIILSGTGSEREYIQRLGRVLRKSSDVNKLAILYEVVTENTSEERTSQRRRGGMQSQKPKPQTIIEPPQPEYQKLETVKLTPIYGVNRETTKKAAESPAKWGEHNDDDIPW
jgi:DNA or RNA helicases of superfamily II